MTRPVVTLGELEALLEHPNAGVRRAAAKGIDQLRRKEPPRPRCSRCGQPDNLTIIAGMYTHRTCPPVAA